MIETPAFWHFAGAYLHQDWRAEYEDVWVAVDAFAQESSVESTALPHEIADVLRRYETDEDLRAFILGQGASYLPEDGASRAWLTEVARRVSAATEGNAR